METWYYFAIIAAVFFGLMVVLIKVMITKGIGSELLTAYFFTITSIMLWVYILLTHKVAIPNQSVLILLIISSAIAVIANLLGFKAIGLSSNPGYYRAIDSIGIIVAFIISIFVFNLKPDLFGILGITFIVIGVILLSRVV